MYGLRYKIVKESRNECSVLYITTKKIPEQFCVLVIIYLNLEANYGSGDDKTMRSKILSIVITNLIHYGRKKWNEITTNNITIYSSILHFRKEMKYIKSKLLHSRQQYNSFYSYEQTTEEFRSASFHQVRRKETQFANHIYLLGKWGTR